MLKAVLFLSMIFVSDVSLARYAHIKSKGENFLLFDNHDHPNIYKMFPKNVSVISRVNIPSHFSYFGMNINEDQIETLNSLFSESELLGVAYFTPENPLKNLMTSYENVEEENIFMEIE